MVPWYFALVFSLILYAVCFGLIITYLYLKRKRRIAGTLLHILENLHNNRKPYLVTEQTNDLVQAIEKDENDEYFRRLGEWNCTPSSWDTTDEDALSTHSTDSNETITLADIEPLTEKEIEKLREHHPRLWYAEYIVDGELTLSPEEFQEEFRKRFIYSKFPKNEYYDN